MQCSQEAACVAPRSLEVADAVQKVPCLHSKEVAGRSSRNLCFNISVWVSVSECVRVLNNHQSLASVRVLRSSS